MVDSVFHEVLKIQFWSLCFKSLQWWIQGDRLLDPGSAPGLEVFFFKWKNYLGAKNDGAGFCAWDGRYGSLEAVVAVSLIILR